MTEQAPAKSGFPRWLIIVGIVGVLCICIFFGAVILTLLSPSLEAARLPEVCVRNNPDMGRQACDAWANEIAGSAAFSDCFQKELDATNPSADHLYACLVENGAGPE